MKHLDNYETTRRGVEPARHIRAPLCRPPRRFEHPMARGVEAHVLDQRTPVRTVLGESYALLGNLSGFK